MALQGEEKPRLCVLTTTFPRWAGDAEPPFVFELSRRLAEHFHVIVLAPRSPGAAEHEQMDRLDVWRYPYCLRSLEQLAYGGGILGNIRSRAWRVLLVPFLIAGLFCALRRLLRTHSVDVVHAHWLFPQGWVATFAVRPGRPSLVVTAHGADVFALRGRLWQRVRSRVVRRADALTAVSGAVADVLSGAAAPPDKLSIIPMGVDLRQTFVPEPRDVRSDHELLFVGRLVPKKGAAVLLQALASLSARGLRPKLMVAGDGPERVSLQRLVEQLGLSDDVVFLGSVANVDLPKLYRRAAALVVPFVVAEDGDQDGLGLVVIEAMGCGCPVVGTPLITINEVVEQGASAWIAGSASAEALAKVIEAALADPEEAARRALLARERVVSRFDWTAIALRYRAILESGLSGQAGHLGPDTPV